MINFIFGFICGACLMGIFLCGLALVLLNKIDRWS
jgi:hypothetical protein